VHDPTGPEDATFIFTFNPPIESFQMWVRSVAPWESIEFQSPFPASVYGLQLVTDGTPIRSVRGFYQNDQNEGAVTWDGPGLTSVTFTMAHADGAIELPQMGQASLPYLEDGLLMQATPVSGGVQLSLAVSDAGGVPTVQGFVIQRHAIYPCTPGPWETVHCITSRQPGSVLHSTILDTNGVQPNTQYAYRVYGWSDIPCVPDAEQHDFQGAFNPTGWPDEILSFVSTGIEPVPIAHGRVVSQWEDGLYFVGIEQCEDSCNPYPFGTYTQDVLQYLGTNTEVLLYGQLWWESNAHGYLSNFASAEPQTCTLSVQSTTWSLIKQLYRNSAASGR
jgi:hypothetical protein